MAQRIHRNDLLLIGPLGERANVRGWLRVGEIRPDLSGKHSLEK
jgi:hypothetical protein